MVTMIIDKSKKMPKRGQRTTTHNKNKGKGKGTMRKKSGKRGY